MYGDDLNFRKGVALRSRRHGGVFAKILLVPSSEDVNGSLIYNVIVFSCSWFAGLLRDGTLRLSIELVKKKLQCSVGGVFCLFFYTIYTFLHEINGVL